MNHKHHLFPAPADLAEIRKLRGVAQANPIQFPAWVRIPIAVALGVVAVCFVIVAFTGELKPAGVEIAGFAAFLAFYVTLGWRFELAFRRWLRCRRLARNRASIEPVIPFVAGRN